jgi:hypothetical protein
MIEKIDEHRGGTHPKLRGQSIAGRLPDTNVSLLQSSIPFESHRTFGVAACGGALLVIAVEAVRWPLDYVIFEHD